MAAPKPEQSAVYGNPEIPPEEIKHFSSISISAPTINDPAFKPMYLSRSLTHNGRGHTLMGGTWNTEQTIAHLLSFYRSESSTDRAEVRRFYTFGSGLNAHPDLLHGGVIACVLDSTMGNVVGLAFREMGADGGASMFTAQLNTKYEKPVRTPVTVMARAWVKRIEDGGRKVWVEGVIEGGEKGELTHARAEGLWIRAKPKKEKL
ncbi:hypothetical protein PMZ80_006141 [Knufia obscura]|uniref:Thioesterase domain-containing protein n=2 Tax=Knufia TaxID=430999 RepID=A0AAN8EFW3_9EURO|nr:hypothetical protein PMZ80_006141 [Knufia obscura]KAK5954809.1 hypothetical protein OHC33_004535 [Knufia fluminis]